MNPKFYTLRLLIVFLLVSGFNQLSNAQDVYWREGFENSQGFPSAVPFVPTHVASSASGTWYLFLSNRNVGPTGGCVINGGSADHARFYNYNNYIGSNPNLTAADSGYLITPVVDFGIKELHFSRGRASRRLTIYKTYDTAANTANWVLVAQSSTVIAQLCTDSLWNVDDANARRLKIVARSGTDTDIDSVWMVSTSPILPVKFNGVYAATVNGFTKVSWNIATEINTRNYIIEKSANGTSFSIVGTLPANNAGTYAWIDNAASTGVSFYRVKAVDIDGKFAYSGVVRVSTTKGRPEFLLAPNVISGRTLYLQLNNFERGSLLVRVSNNIGQVVYTSSMVIEGNSSLSKTIQLPANLSAGTYRVQLLTSGLVLTQTAVLQ